MSIVYSFPPIIDENSKILVLGSMPGEMSLLKKQYYTHPRNQFWKIIYGIYGLKMDEKYDNKVDFLKEKRIALWDVIQVCYRAGSMDSDIMGEEANDIGALLIKYPNIDALFFNGSKAYEVYKKKIGFDEKLRYFKLGSTSPANAKNACDRINEWSQIKRFLEN